jgi:hypothetical protein
MLTVPAVLGAIPVIHLALVRRVRGLLEEFLDEVDGVVLGTIRVA